LNGRRLLVLTASLDSTAASAVRPATSEGGLSRSGTSRLPRRGSVDDDQTSLAVPQPDSALTCVPVRPPGGRV